MAIHDLSKESEAPETSNRGCVFWVLLRRLWSAMTGKIGRSEDHPIYRVNADDPAMAAEAAGP